MDFFCFVVEGILIMVIFSLQIFFAREINENPSTPLKLDFSDIRNNDFLLLTEIARLDRFTELS